MALAKQKYVPKHRQSPARTHARRVPRSVARRTALFSTVAVTATGVAVTNGMAATPGPVEQLGASLGTPLAAPEPEDRTPPVSRSDNRKRTDATKEAALAPGNGGAVTRSEDLSEATPREIGRALLPKFGFSADQFSCLDQLYISESNWRVDADNPTSSAYGIPQALTQLHDLPPGYMTSAVVQIRWGLDYIRENYGTPCSAWSFKQANNWY